MFFSATLDGAIGRLAEVYTRDPMRHEVGPLEGRFVEEADHRFSRWRRTTRWRPWRSWRRTSLRSTLVFVNTKRADRPGPPAPRGGCPGRGDARRHDPAGARARAPGFEDGHVGVLVATDVAARGLDLERITLVVNYDPPKDDKGRAPCRTHRARRACRHEHHVRHAEQLGDVSRWRHVSTTRSSSRG